MNALNDAYRAIAMGQQLGQAVRRGQDRRDLKRFQNQLAAPLKDGNYQEAADIAFDAGRIDTGMNFRQMAAAQAKADSQEMAAQSAQFRDDYGTFTDTFGRIAAMRARGVIDDNQYKSAKMAAAQNLSVLARNNPQLAEMMPQMLQQVNAMPPEALAAYSEEYGKAMFDAADPNKKLEGDIKRGRLALDRDKFKLESRKVNAEIDKMNREAEQGKPPEFADVIKVQDRFEKQAVKFEEAQRQFNTMSQLAQDGTGASDVALGFAFFKTIDPSSTVREGEFAQAATAMGLGGRTVALMKSLDKGTKFTPQLRQELVQAASRAYEEQAEDMARLQERTTDFAQRWNINPADVTRDVARPAIGAAPAVGASGASGVPQQAVEYLLANPALAAQFNEKYGPGAAEQILNGQ